MAKSSRQAGVAKSDGKSNGRAATRARSNGAARGAALKNGNGSKTLPVLADERTQLPCLSCGLCCTYLAVEIDGPTSVRGASEILWFLYHKGACVYVEDDDWLLQIETRCRHLREDNGCAIYEQRPQICRDYDETGCEVNADEVGIAFFEPDEFLDYLQRHHKRIHTLLSKNHVPGEDMLTRHARIGRKLPSYRRRWNDLRAVGVGS
ncbi:MAG: YkgJ family cysteine cluster protein [Myxococcales bacterium]|nr:YkgJ family cysteine cluster protein [Myxococcales bacterium]